MYCPLQTNAEDGGDIGCREQKSEEIEAGKIDQPMEMEPHSDQADMQEFRNDPKEKRNNDHALVNQDYDADVELETDEAIQKPLTCLKKADSPVTLPAFVEQKSKEVNINTYKMDFEGQLAEKNVEASKMLPATSNNVEVESGNTTGSVGSAIKATEKVHPLYNDCHIGRGGESKRLTRSVLASRIDEALTSSAAQVAEGVRHAEPKITADTNDIQDSIRKTTRPKRKMNVDSSHSGEDIQSIQQQQIEQKEVVSTKTATWPRTNLVSSSTSLINRSPGSATSASAVSSSEDEGVIRRSTRNRKPTNKHITSAQMSGPCRMAAPSPIKKVMVPMETQETAAQQNTMGAKSISLANLRHPNKPKGTLASATKGSKAYVSTSALIAAAKGASSSIKSNATRKITPQSPMSEGGRVHAALGGLGSGGQHYSYNSSSGSSALDRIRSRIGNVTKSPIKVCPFICWVIQKSAELD